MGTKTPVRRLNNLNDFSTEQQYELNQGLFQDSIITDRGPYVGEVVPIAVLSEEGSAFVHQINVLKAKGYHFIQKTRGDRNYFYQALAFAFIERLIHHSPSISGAPEILGKTREIFKEHASFGFAEYKKAYGILANLIGNIPKHNKHEMTSTPLETFRSAESASSLNLL
ncbi:hypothetical protein DXG03_008249 [Asterophora parasitica]|uniref:Uncharacterized protein n=1 Tax=Asterophora parasitica TaxID=117018 RepID=A0A9P7G5M3_9AGAR|nr:hypothetical protein DXG03_008249 [Asterophora parasitica]